MLWLRATGSTVVSQLIDTVTICFVAWSGKMGTDKILDMIVTNYSLKIIIAVSLTPLVYLIHALVERGLGIQPAPLDVAAGEVSAEVASGGQ
jgi:uncharacterized integral membrane protein (TIGR00697 family)